MARTEEQKRKAAEYARQWRAKQGDQYRTYASKYQKEWRRKNRASWKESHKKTRRKLRLEVLAFFGGKCCRCGFSDWRALQIDHINGCGNDDKLLRVKIGGGVMHKVRRFIYERPEEAKAKYQCLCANCNWIKRFENDEHSRKGKLSC